MNGFVCVCVCVYVCVTCACVYVCGARVSVPQILFAIERYFFRNFLNMMNSRYIGLP